MRHVLGLDLHHDDALVQRLVVLQRMQQRDRHMRQIARHEDRRARHPHRPLRVERLDELLERHRVAGALLGQQPAAAPPCPHDREDQRSRRRSGTSRLRAIFSRLALRNVRSTIANSANSGTATARLQPWLRMYRKASPVVIAIIAADRDAVGRAEIVGGPEAEHQDDDRDRAGR